MEKCLKLAAVYLIWLLRDYSRNFYYFRINLGILRLQPIEVCHDTTDLKPYSLERSLSLDLAILLGTLLALIWVGVGWDGRIWSSREDYTTSGCEQCQFFFLNKHKYIRKSLLGEPSGPLGQECHTHFIQWAKQLLWRLLRTGSDIVKQVKQISLNDG